MPRATYPELRAPDATYVRARWIPERQVDYAKEAAAYIREHGAVYGATSSRKRSNARWHARKLIRLLIELRLFERDELAEHTERRPDGRYAWSVEFAKPREG